MDDPFGLERFLHAQEAAYEPAMAELRQGRKQGHWMWYVFPQLAGLGKSEMAQRYSISGRDEAAAYLQHRVLGSRLVASARVVAGTSVAAAEDLFGPLDAVKLRSSMTLFKLAALDAGEQVALTVCGIVLDRFYGGHPDPATIDLLAAA
ncbi:MAG TPA: DUF1810 domain-containing protein [Candidatus Nanopelagicales bacterium]|nr:DUF1810 domain-containing protein [Candidatus Nanopelagicales bacterium]